jgi:hypothetical protein
MPRLLVHVEGQTEEAFVDIVLNEHLIRSGFSSVKARLLGNPRLRSKRGGVRSWQSARNDIIRHIKQDGGAITATIVDYYALPHDWPGRAEASGMGTTSSKAQRVETALLDDIRRQFGDKFDSRRFVPLVMMHEFEALLFSDPRRFAEEIGKPELAQSLTIIRTQFETPEDINDSVDTAPSKRIIRIFPGYEKPLFGALTAIGIGLAKIRGECPHFNDWLTQLETLPPLFAPASK